jgi:beta-lactamase regulating signal transducer with metallopeptidase domain
MNGATIDSIAWALIHSLWQQGLVALALWFMLRRTAHWSASSRYLLGCGALAVASLLPIVTFSLLASASPPELPSATAGAGFSPAVLEGDDGAFPSVGEEWLPAQASLLAPIARPLVGCWLAGVLFFGVRFLGGWIYLQHLRWVGIVPPEARWRRLLEELAPRLGVVRPVWLYESPRVIVPTLIGWLRPVILVPVGMLTGMTPAQVEAVFAHELAHVKRHDYLVNLAQSLLDVFYYYSPGAWYLSRVIREERENCCDDLAIDATGNPLALGRALAELERVRRDAIATPALAATGGSLLARVRRLVRPYDPPEAPTPRTALAPLVGVVVAMLVLLPMGESIAETTLTAEYSEPFTPATHETYLKGRQVLWLQAENVTLAEACERLSALSGLRFELPPEAAAQRVSLDFQNVSAGSIITSIFNLLEMDYPVDPDTGIVRPAYWPGSGPRPQEVLRLSRPFFHARQTMFLGLKHDLHWSSREQITLGEGIRRLTEISGITFVFSDPDLAALPVDAYLPNGTVRGGLHAMLRPHGLSYRYLDDSRILLER